MKKVQQGMVAAVAVVAGTVLFFVVMRKPPTERAVPAGPAAVAAAPAPSPAAPEPEVITIPLPQRSEEEIKELRYLPERVQLSAARENAMLNAPEMKSGVRRVRNVRPLTNKAKDGDFLSPRWSPDGLQMLVSRPGFSGVYLVDVNSGRLQFIAPGNAFRARWTPDGNIEVAGEDGQTRVFAPDGALLSTRATDNREGPTYAENDTVFVRTPDGATKPLTTSDDRYFNPVLSPDGKQIVYQGLMSGLYMAPADGSGAPVYLGTGNNPAWMPDGSGVVFDVTTDDGHNLTGGDIYHVDSAVSERTNLTEGDSLIGQMPSVDPSGRQVAFESEGQIFVGEVQ